MKKIIYDVNIENIDKVYHVADIHIRNLKRHREYRAQFEKLYDEIKKDTKNAMCVVAGDIVHAKTEMSPELIKMTKDFLSSLADILPTIVILGNHDCNLNNPSRLDALTPIIDSMNHGNLFYLKDSGIYTFGDTDFVVMSILENPSEYIKSDECKSKNKIALYHGPVNNSTTDIGYRISNEELGISMFSGYDITMLGDIHKKQFLNDEKTIAYPGSLIQQNHGESFENHGVLIWNVPKRKSRYVHIDNDFGFYTISVKNGKMPDLTKVPKHPRLRVQFEKTDSADQQTIIAELKTRYNVQDIVVNTLDKLSQIKTGNVTITSAIGNVRDITQQNKLIADYLKRNFDGIDDSIVKNVKSINRQTNADLADISISRNIIIKPKKFTFENMFSYGGGNTVNFEDMKGVHGMFAPNHSGKSSLLDALSFCCFDRCSRTKMAANVMNNKKDTFDSLYNFEIEGVDYFIRRRGKKNKYGEVRVDVDFWYIDEAGEEVSLNGEQRKDTNNNIRGFLGAYEDFVLTCLSVQGQSNGFIDKSQTERKDILAQFSDITVFEELYTLANNEMKGVNSLLKEFKKQDFSTTFAESEKKLAEYKFDHKSAIAEKNKYKDERKNIESEILEKTKNLRTINDVASTNIEKLENDKEDKIVIVDDCQKTMDSVIENAKTLSKNKNELTQKIDKYDAENIRANVSRHEELEIKINKVEGEIQLLKNDVKHKIQKVKILEGLNPSCDFCNNNEIIKSAKGVKVELDNDKIKAADITAILKNLKDEKDSLQHFVDQWDLYLDDSKELEKINLIVQQEKSKYKNAESKKELALTEILLIDSKIEKYYENEESIKHNQKIQNEIDKLNVELESCIEKIEEYTREENKLNSACNVEKNTIAKIKETLKMVKELESKYQAYEYYLDAISRDGVPYELIAAILPMVENEVNNILSQMVDFEIIFSVDGKNIITQIKYDDSNIWDLSLTSGMEKFISSLAIRTALINVSNLPRPNFIAIDEGFGNLDSDNMNSIFMLFNYLKSKFDFVMIVSHVESMRDVVDQLMEIKVQGGYSQINH